MRAVLSSRTDFLVYSAVSLALGVSLLGCDSDLDREDLRLSKAVLAVKNPNPEEKDIELQKKLAAYIRCINSESKRVVDSKRRYTSWIADTNQGPSCKERNIYAPYRLNSITNCTAMLESANRLKPSLPKLEKNAATYARALGVLAPLLEQANTYYSGRRYRQDDCALGKSLHPKLMAAFELANGSDLGMRARVEFHNGELQKRRMERTQKRYGTNHPRYYRRLVMAEAKLLLKVLQEQTRAKTPNIAQLEAAATRYHKAVATMQGAPASASGGVSYSFFKSQAQSFAQAGDEYVARKREGRAFSRTEARWLRSGSSGWLVKGSYARALKRYNALVDRFNAVRFPASR